MAAGLMPVVYISTTQVSYGVIKVTKERAKLTTSASKQSWGSMNSVNNLMRCGQGWRICCTLWNNWKSMYCMVGYNFTLKWVSKCDLTSSCPESVWLATSVLLYKCMQTCSRLKFRFFPQTTHSVGHAQAHPSNMKKNPSKNFSTYVCTSVIPYVLS